MEFSKAFSRSVKVAENFITTGIHIPSIGVKGRGKVSILKNYKYKTKRLLKIGLFKLFAIVLN